MKVFGFQVRGGRFEMMREGINELVNDIFHENGFTDPCMFFVKKASLESIQGCLFKIRGLLMVLIPYIKWVCHLTKLDTVSFDLILKFFEEISANILDAWGLFLRLFVKLLNFIFDCRNNLRDFFHDPVFLLRNPLLSIVADFLNKCLCRLILCIKLFERVSSHPLDKGLQIFDVGVQCLTRFSETVIC